MREKINSSAYNFLLVFAFILRKKEFAIEDVILHLENSHEIYLFKEAILKYIRTMKYLGFKFKRLNNKTYTLCDIPLKMELSNNEKERIFNFINIFADYQFADKKMFLDKLKLFLPNDLQNKIDKRFSMLELAQNKLSFQNLKKLCMDSQRLKITYLKEGKKQVSELFEPFDIFTEINSVYLLGFNLSEKSNLLINKDWILDVEQTPLKNKFLYKKDYATVKFSTKSAKSYTFSEEDEIISNEGDILCVKMFYSDKHNFFRKILRYMDTCEIIAPSSLRKAFANYVEELYQIYDCTL